MLIQCNGQSPDFVVELNNVMLTLPGEETQISQVRKTLIFKENFETVSGGKVPQWNMPDIVKKTVYPSTKHKHTGKRGLQVQFRKPESHLPTQITGKTLTLEPGADYILTYWVRSDGAKTRSNGGGGVRLVTPSGEDLVDIIKKKVFRFEYTEISFNFNAGTHSTAQLQVGGWEMRNGTFWFDDITLHKIER